MINKAFKKLGINDPDFINKNKIDLFLRAEKLTEDQFYSIAEYYEKTK
jgi:16S rRNA A1518/A1519 N6-dimethyltransferase RsmA/KsgA/DIM1 with predicted DNA glycosylase/AP lyase activity